MLLAYVLMRGPADLEGQGRRPAHCPVPARGEGRTGYLEALEARSVILDPGVELRHKIEYDKINIFLGAAWIEAQFDRLQVRTPNRAGPFPVQIEGRFR